jgi:hypothetical protein
MEVYHVNSPSAGERVGALHREVWVHGELRVAVEHDGTMNGTPLSIVVHHDSLYRRTALSSILDQRIPRS